MTVEIHNFQITVIKFITIIQYYQCAISFGGETSVIAFYRKFVNFFKNKIQIKNEKPQIDFQIDFFSNSKNEYSESHAHAILSEFKMYNETNKEAEPNRRLKSMFDLIERKTKQTMDTTIKMRTTIKSIQ